MAVLSVLHPELFEWKMFSVSVASSGPKFGRTIGSASEDGLVAVGVNINEQEAKARIAEILAT